MTLSRLVRVSVHVGQTGTEFGRLTLAGEGGIPVTATTITSGDSSGHWQIVGGVLSPTAAAVSAGYGQAPYSLRLNDGTELTITCPDNVRHVATIDEINQAGAETNNGGPMSGKTVRIRPGSYGQWAQTGNFLNVPQRVTFEAADPNNRPIIRNIRIIGQQNTNIGNVTLRNLRFIRPLDPLNHSFIGPSVSGGYAVVVISGDNVRVENCEVTTDMQIGRDSGGQLIEQMPGILANGSNIELIGNDIHHISIGLQFNIDGGLVEGNRVHDFYSDGVRLGGKTHDCAFRNNYIYDMMGFGSVLHGDGIQFSDPSRGAIANVDIEGNIFMLGAGEEKGVRSAPFDATPRTVRVSGDITLDVSAIGARIERESGNTSSYTLTLPDPSLYPQESIWFNGGATYSITLAGNIEGGNVTMSGEAYRGTYAVRSNGTQWQRAPLGLRAGIGLVTSSLDLTPRSYGLIYRVDASAGNVLIRLPPLAEGAQVGFARIDNTPNTVTVVPIGADAMQINLKNTPVASYSIRPLDACTIQNTNNGGVWNIRASVKYLQGIFGNSNSSWTIARQSDGGLGGADANNVHRVDATLVPLDVTLPDITTLIFNIGFHRIDAVSGNVVRIYPRPGNTLTLGGTPVDFYTLPPNGSATMEINGSNWEITAGEAYLDATFPNSYTKLGGQGNITVRGNIVYTDAAWHYRLEESNRTIWPNGNWFGYCRIYNNDFLRVGHQDENGDGQIDELDGWFDTTIPMVAPQSIRNSVPADDFCVRNVIAGLLNPQGWNDAAVGGLRTFFGAGTPDENIAMNLGQRDGNRLDAAYDAIMSPPPQPGPNKYKPKTPAEAIAISQRINAGTRGAAYYWDFAAGRKRTGASEPVIPG